LKGDGFVETNENTIAWTALLELLEKKGLITYKEFKEQVEEIKMRASE
jgi:hypothetical protein